MSHLEKHPEETREHWEEQQRKINSLGSIREILNNKELLLEILTYFGDRHLIGQFYDMLNDAIEQGEVLPEDLAYLRSGWLGNCIVNLNDYVNNVGRNLYPFEIGDKLNYTTLVRDTETQIATFTNKRVIEAIAGITPDKQLSYCEQSLGYLTPEAQLRVIQEIMKVGNIEKAMYMLNELTKKLESARKYEEEKRSYSNSR